MKKIVAVLLLWAACTNGIAQSTSSLVDKSPLDISYYPDNYPVLKIQNKVSGPLLTRVVYSRPQKNNRVIFGSLIEYDKIWRLGANEATEIEFFQNVKIKNVRIKKGRYTIYTIPKLNNWTLILNKETDTWGSFGYDSTKDVLRIELPVAKQKEIVEYFTIGFEKATGGFTMIITWDDVKVTLPVYL